MTAADDSTVVVELTPQARAAVAVVVVAGPGAAEAIRRHFTSVRPSPAGGAALNRIMLGRWGGAEGEELIVCRRREDEFEVHCHGGAAAVKGVIDRLVESGCRRIAWQDWLRRRSCDALCASAQIALAEAPTVRTAAVLLDQFHGALLHEVKAARGAMAAGSAELAGQIVERILAFRDVGLHLTMPWQVVLAGPPNVGKSSLINAIAGYQRAIVSPTPGTTRDVVTVATAINGWPVQLADTAGLRQTQDELESAGVELAGAAIRAADLVILVLDAARPDLESDFQSWIADAARVMVVWNKIDLWERDAPLELQLGGGDAPARGNPQFVSALTGEGIAEMIAAIGDSLVPIAPPAGAAVPFTAEQVARLESARAALLAGDLSAAEAALAALLAGA